MKVQQDPMMEKLKKAGAEEKYLKKLEIIQAPYKEIFREVLPFLNKYSNCIFNCFKVKSLEYIGILVLFAK